MHEDHEKPPFDRTVCACARCQSCCRQQPGHLIPGDAERIAEFLGEPVEKYLWATPGATVRNTQTGVQSQIRTVTPRLDKNGCVFLTAEGRCKIHPVAPFGCAYFDTHMSNALCNKRGMWGLSQIQFSEEYKALRARLPLAVVHRPFRAGPVTGIAPRSVHIDDPFKRE